ncbi:ATP-dependent DNA helicase PIF1-like protein [Tanacetum coccineum]
MLDNRWVVPYNAYLLAKFDCHINVEICSTIKAVKYIYKYICKGSDRITFAVSSSNGSTLVDEIEQYQSGRWVSPPEAAWRIFRFPLSEIKPAVIHLQLHLENHQPLTFKKKDKLANVLQNPIQRITMLTEFFSMNRNDELAQSLNLTYPEFPDYFVWQQDKRFWKRRKFGDSVGRIVAAHPSEGERYYLRILLKKVRCPKSFDDLKTCNGVRVATFREAALLRGYLIHDNSQQLCLEEASVYHLPYELRRLFATLPVVRKGTKSETMDACLTNSPLWPSLHKLHLEENMRALLDPNFTEFLLEIGNGKETSLNNDLVNIPASMLIETLSENEPLDTLIDHVYPDIQLQSSTNSRASNRAILTTKNCFVDEINDILIARLIPGEETEYVSCDETLDPDDQTQYEDFLHSLTPNGMPPHRLVLKPNSPIILLRNLNPTEGLCNGTRLICKDLKKKCHTWRDCFWKLCW